MAGEILFTYQAEGFAPLNWRALIEPETGAVLRAEALVSCVHGMVLERDPLTSSGANTLPTVTCGNAQFAADASVELPGIASVTGQPHELRGPFIRLANVSAPIVSPPTVANGSAFDFAFTTDDFAAVNGYYHCDRCFRLIDEMGFDVSSYFDGTQFPVTRRSPSEHRRTGKYGERGSAGQHHQHRFGWLSICASRHWNNHRHGCRAAGNLARVRPCAPMGSPAPSQFPLRAQHRRHPRGDSARPGIASPRQGPHVSLDDHNAAPRPCSRNRLRVGRAVQDDTLPVGNFLSHDRAGYKREQILSSTLFRLYLALGGGHDDIAVGVPPHAAPFGFCLRPLPRSARPPSPAKSAGLPAIVDRGGLVQSIAG